MRVRFTTAAIAAALVSATGSACAVSTSDGDPVSCTVVDGGKLPAGSGGAEAICGAIRQEAEAQAPGVSFSVEVRVLSPSQLAAIVTTAAGRRLPEMRLVTADREIAKSSLERFARSIIAQIQADRD